MENGSLSTRQTFPEPDLFEFPKPDSFPAQQSSGNLGIRECHCPCQIRGCRVTCPTEPRLCFWRRDPNFAERFVCPNSRCAENAESANSGTLCYVGGSGPRPRKEKESSIAAIRSSRKRRERLSDSVLLNNHRLFTDRKIIDSLDLQRDIGNYFIIMKSMNVIESPVNRFLGATVGRRSAIAKTLREPVFYGERIGPQQGAVVSSYLTC